MFQKYGEEFKYKNLNFNMYSGDRAQDARKYLKLGPLFAYNTTEKLRGIIHPVPDFIYSHAPEIDIENWNVILKQCKEKACFPYVENKCFWIGDIHKHRSRRRLIKLSGRYPHLLKAISMEWKYYGPHSNFSISDGRKAASAFVPIPDHAKYKYLIDIQGTGYSARLKLLMHLKRPVFIADRKYEEFFYPHMIPFRHYIPIKENLSDLIRKIQWLEKDEEYYRLIVNETEEFAEKFLTKDFALESLYRTIVMHGMS